MTNEDIQAKLVEVFRDVFEDDQLDISRTTTAEDVDGWDSLTHVSLMINVERAFGLKFSSTQVASLKNVGELIDLVSARVAAKGA